MRPSRRPRGAPRTPFIAFAVLISCAFFANARHSLAIPPTQTCADSPGPPDAGAPPATTVCHSTAPLDAYIRQAVWSEGLLWIVDHRGWLASIDLHAATIERHITDAYVTAIFRSSSGALWAATLDWGHRAQARARVRAADGTESWPVVVDAPTTETDAWLAEFEGASLLGNSSAIFRGAGTTLRKTALGALLRGPPMPISAAVVGQTVYAGTNNGEWGGGLHALSIATGAVQTFGGGLPVPDVVPDIARPGCVLAAVAYGHALSEEGRVLRACGDEVTTDAEWRLNDRSGLRRSEPVVSIVPASDGYWASTPYAVHHRSGTRMETVPYPPFASVCGVEFARLGPGIMALRALGSAPILVATRVRSGK